MPSPSRFYPPRRGQITQTKLIGHNRQNKQHSQHHGLQIRFDPRKIHPVLNQTDKQGAQNDILKPPDSAAQTDPGNHASGDRFQRHRSANVRLACLQPRRQQHPRHRAEQPAQNICEKKRSPRVDPGKSRRFYISADGVNMPPGGSPIKQRRQRDNQSRADNHRRRRAPNRPKPEHIAKLGGHSVNRNSAGQIQRDAEADRSHAQRHHKRRHIKNRDAHAVDDSDHRARRHAGATAKRDRRPCRVRPSGVSGGHRRRADHRRQRQNRADRKIKTAGQKGEHLPHRDNRQINRLPHHIGQVSPSQKTVGGKRKNNHRRDKQKRQHAQPDKQSARDSRERKRLRFVVSFVHAAFLSKKWGSTRLSVISSPSNSACTRPR